LVVLIYIHCVNRALSLKEIMKNINILLRVMALSDFVASRAALAGNLVRGAAHGTCTGRNPLAPRYIGVLTSTT